MRISVIAVTCMCGLHLGFGTGASWGVLVEGWGNPVVWQKTPWEASMLPFTTGLSMLSPSLLPSTLSANMSFSGLSRANLFRRVRT